MDTISDSQTIINTKRKRRTKKEMEAFRLEKQKKMEEKKTLRQKPFQMNLFNQDSDDFREPSDEELDSIEKEFDQDSNSSDTNMKLKVRLIVSSYTDFFNTYRENSIYSLTKKIGIDPITFSELNNMFGLIYDRSELYQIRYKAIKQEYKDQLCQYFPLLKEHVSQNGQKTFLAIFNADTNKVLGYISKSFELGSDFYHKENGFVHEWFPPAYDYVLWVPESVAKVLTGNYNLELSLMTSINFKIIMDMDSDLWDDIEPAYVSTLKLANGWENELEGFTMYLKFKQQPLEVSVDGGVYKPIKNSDNNDPVTSDCYHDKDKNEQDSVYSYYEESEDYEKEDEQDNLDDDKEVDDEEIDYYDKEDKDEPYLIDSPNWGYGSIDNEETKYFGPDNNPYYSGTRLEKEAYTSLSDGAYRSRNMGLSDGSYDLDD